MPQVVTELTGGVASYVARLPMPAPDAKTWLESVTVSAPLAVPKITVDNQEHNTDDQSGHLPDESPDRVPSDQAGGASKDGAGE